MAQQLPTPQEIQARLAPIRQQIDEMAESYYELKGGQLKLVYRLLVPKELVVDMKATVYDDYKVMQTEIDVP